MTKTTVGANLLQPFKILTELVFQLVRCDLRELAIFDVLLSVQEPIRNFILTGVGHDSDELLNLEKTKCLGKF